MDITVTLQIGEAGKATSFTLPLTADFHRPGATVDGGPLSRLTPGELRVLRLVAAGIEYKEAGRILHVSGGTIRTHMNRITAKLDVPNGRMAGALALVSGLLTAEDLLQVWAEHRGELLAEHTP